MMEAETENNSQRVMIDVRIVMRNSTAMEATVSLMIALMIHGVCLKKKLLLFFSGLNGSNDNRKSFPSSLYAGNFSGTTVTTPLAPPLPPRRFGIKENERVF